MKETYYGLRNKTSKEHIKIKISYSLQIDFTATYSEGIPFIGNKYSVKRVLEKKEESQYFQEPTFYDSPSLGVISPDELEVFKISIEFQD